MRSKQHDITPMRLMRPLSTRRVNQQLQFSQGLMLATATATKWCKHHLQIANRNHTTMHSHTHLYRLKQGSQKRSRSKSQGRPTFCEYVPLGLERSSSFINTRTIINPSEVGSHVPCVARHSNSYGGGEGLSSIVSHRDIRLIFVGKRYF